MIIVFTDGSCVQGNPGLASGAYVLTRNDKMLESLGMPLGKRTINAAELIAALNGLRAAESYLEISEDIILVSDSRYVISSIFRCNDFCKNPTRPNMELLMALCETLNGIWNKGGKVLTKWVKGHHTNQGNKMCDRLARMTALSQRYHYITKDGNYMMENGNECKGIFAQGTLEGVGVV